MKNLKDLFLTYSTYRSRIGYPYIFPRLLLSIGLIFFMGLTSCKTTLLSKSYCNNNPIFKYEVDSFYTKSIGSSLWLVKSIRSDEFSGFQSIETKSKQQAFSIVFTVDSSCKIIAATVNLGEVY